LLGSGNWVLKVGKSIVFNGKMGIRKFWSMALPFGKVACTVKVLFYFYIHCIILYTILHMQPLGYGAIVLYI